MMRRQCLAARAILGWSIDQLAEKAQVGSATISRFENRAGNLNRHTERALVAAFEHEGIVFASAAEGYGVTYPHELQLADEQALQANLRSHAEAREQKLRAKYEGGGDDTKPR